MTLEQYENACKSSSGVVEDGAGGTSRTVSDDLLKDALKRANLLSLLDRFDWQDRSLPLHQLLSGGEKQRLGFARLFFHRPRFAVIDEGTAALDSENEERMYT
jgi:ABC-type uncharacterized transport system fused permease/ATPase subunit